MQCLKLVQKRLDEVVNLELPVPAAYMDTQGVKVIRQYALSHLKTDLFHTIFIPNWDQSLTSTVNIIMVSLNPFLAPFLNIVNPFLLSILASSDSGRPFMGILEHLHT